MKSNCRLLIVVSVLVLGSLTAAADTSAPGPATNSTSAQGPASQDSGADASPYNEAGLSREELLAAALRYSPEYTRPVLCSDGMPLAVYHELNGDGALDVALITVLAEAGVPSSLEELRQHSRLFRRGEPHPLFVLETYFAGDEAVQTVEIGRRPALSGMEVLPLNSIGAFPVAIAARTRGEAGTETNLFIYSPGGMVRRYELRETDQERFEMGDLDGDGFLDIVITRRLPEAGTGYETFVEFLTLDDSFYRVVSSFGLVRELRAFLAHTRELMISGDWSGLGDLVAGQAHTEASLPTAFQGVADDEQVEAFSFDYARTGTAVTDVVFPTLMDNPLPYPYLGEQFTLVFRIQCAGCYPRFYSAVIRLSMNPFESPRFAFLTHDGTQQ